MWLVKLLDLSAPPFDPYGRVGMIFVSGIDDFYTPFLFMAAAFRSMDPSLEEASMASGAGVVLTLRRITLRLMLPAAFAVCLLIFIRGIEDFEIPALLGIPAGIDRKSTRLNSSHVRISYAVFCLKKKKKCKSLVRAFARSWCIQASCRS